MMRLKPPSALGMVGDQKANLDMSLNLDILGSEKHIDMYCERLWT
jgi:hypothetical protein